MPSPPGKEINGIHLRVEDEGIGVSEDISFRVLADNREHSECRKVVDHMVLFRMKDDLKEEQEKEMLESLFTIQYQVKGIISLSAGKFTVTSSLKCYLLYVIDLRATPFVTLNNILSIGDRLFRFFWGKVPPTKSN